MESLQPTPEALGAHYLRGIAKEHRRASGQVYTPLSLVDFVLDQAGYTADAGIENTSILDPCCGSGAFVVAAIRRLSSRMVADGVSIRRATGASRLFDIVASRVRAVDLDQTACKLTERAIVHLLEEITGATPPASLCEAVVSNHDFLGENAETTSFDFIIGNPPYVSTERLSPAAKVDLRQRFRSALGRFDLYTLFMERSIDLLRESGTLCFITPDKYLASQSATPLRRHMLQVGAITTVARFTSHQVFAHAATVPCITVFRRGSKRQSLLLLECVHSAAAVTVRRKSRLKAPRTGSSSWLLSSATTQSVLDKMASGRLTLEAFTRRVSAGLATGRDEVFVVPSSIASRLEPELVRLAVRGRDIVAFDCARPDLHIIVPYSYESGRPRLVTLSHFPRAKRYLENHRSILEKRHCVRTWEKQWFDLHDPVPLDLAAVPKILVPDIAESNRFALDNGGSVPLHSAYYLLPQRIEPSALVALLNSRPLEFFIRAIAPIAKSRFSRYRKQFLLQMPIPAFDAPTLKALSDAGVRGDRSTIDSIVIDAFGLNEGDLFVIDAFFDSLRQAAV